MRRVLSLGIAALLSAAGLLLSPVPAQAAIDRDPVIFVHGYASTASVWDAMIARFRAAGYASDQVFTFQYNFNQSNVTSANQLRSRVSAVLAQTGASRVDLVNHSMGGLVTRYYVKNLGGTSVVDQWGSLAGANHGTTAATLCLLFASCRQMSPGSPFLAQLNSGDETPGPTVYRTWYSACDGVIIPYTSTVLSGATNTNVGCVTHLGFLANGTVANQLIGWLD
jgi:triacylglycerol lipase